MLKIFLHLILILFLYAFSAGFLRGFEFYGALPNLFLLYSLYLAIEASDEFYLPLLFLCGLLLDFSSGLFIGSFSMAFLIIALFFRTISVNTIVIEKNWKYLAGVLAVAQLFMYLWLYFYNLLALALGASADVLVLRELVFRFFWEFIYNLLFFYPIWRLCGLVQKLGKQKAGNIL